MGNHLRAQTLLLSELETRVAHYSQSPRDQGSPTSLSSFEFTVKAHFIVKAEKQVVLEFGSCEVF